MATDAVARGSVAATTTVAVRRSFAVPLAIAGIAILPLLLALPFLGAPMEQDEGVYFAVAAHGWPYGDVFDHKPPLIYGWYKLALLLSGGEPSVESVRVLAAVCVSLAALAVAWTGATLFDRRTGVIAGVLMALSMSNQYLQFNANSEAFMLLPLALSLVAFVRGWRNGSVAWFALAGAFAGAAALTKSVGALHVIAPCAALAWCGGMRLARWRDVGRYTSGLVAGSAAVVIAVLAPFAVAGRWDALTYANVAYNRAYSAQVGFEDKLFGIADVDKYAVIAGLYLWVPAVVGAVLLCRRGASMASALLISGAGAAFVGASLTGREYPHYLIALLPFASLLAAFAIASMTADWRDGRARLHAEALLLLLAIPAIFALIPLYVLPTDDVHMRVYHNGPNARRAIENDAVAAYLRMAAEPGERLFVFGDEAQLFPMSGLPPATYHIRPIADAAVDAATFDRTMRELQAAPPELIVDAAAMELSAGLLGRESQTVTVDAPPALREAFDGFLSARYEVAARIEYAEIWRLKAKDN